MYIYSYQLNLCLISSSSTATGTEFTVSGVVILVTMSSNNTDNGKGIASSFTLRFLHKRNDTIFPPGRLLYPSTLVTEEEPAVVSFPENNAVNYSNNANHFMLISRPSGRDFKTKRTFLDIEAVNDYYRAFSPFDDADKTRICCGPS